MHQKSISGKPDALFGDRLRETGALCAQVNASSRRKLTVGIPTHLGSVLSSRGGSLYFLVQSRL